MTNSLKPIISKSESGEVIQINFKKTDDRTPISYEEQQLLEQQIKLWEQELSGFDKSLKIAKTLLNFKIKTNEEIHNLQCEKSKKFLTSIDHIEILHFLPRNHDNPLEIEIPYLKGNHSEAESIKHLQLLEQIAFDISISTPSEEQLNHIKEKIGFNNAQPNPDDTNGWILWDKAEAPYTLEEINKAVAQVSEEKAKIHYYEFELWKLNYDKRKKHEAEWLQNLTDEYLEQHYKNIIDSLVEQKNNVQKILKAINQYFLITSLTFTFFIQIDGFNLARIDSSINLG
ncbi:hypothetical protein Trichorick_01662 (plasmid) [Candidatus Trichorickettsia mobilis]|uniref:hypothetical protein n=1 Tax=Candidatus Trichorickettsia mobilis TaxID=1346319 RepID=UPI002B2634B6|nr:hypothetical protein [Candidatus Trichorickettsia mobilis]WPY01744.1 hypothetical protein Trichorick_01662 [Candidatus Trichorickettsia mobilis]